jgi:coenzyme F420-0:L-glutamate ligase/coenzyme F420-1:gamma-L-glutamate ligase
MDSPAIASRMSGRPPTIAELAFVQDRRVGRLATVNADGSPTVVPFCYAVLHVDGEPLVVSPLDEKPKHVPVRELARVRNILARPDVSMVVDDYHEDWSTLAFTQLHGRAELIEPGHPMHAQAVSALRAKYPQYEHMAIDALPLIAIRQLQAKTWAGAGTDRDGPLARPGETELAALLRGRRSVRSFQSSPVPREIIERAIAAAGWAPSPHGRQPWRFAIVEAAERRVSLATAMAESWRTQLELDGQPPEIVQIRLDKSRQRLHDAPILIVPCLYLAELDQYPDPGRQEAERIMAIHSLGAAIQNLLLAIYAAGLDTGWMCAPLFCPDLVRQELGLGPDLTPHALIPVGYAAKDPVRRGRLPLDALIVQWD